MTAWHAGGMVRAPDVIDAPERDEARRRPSDGRRRRRRIVAPPVAPRRVRTTGSSTGSAWRSSPPAASTSSSSSGRRSCCATPRSPVATPARTSGSPTSSIDHFLPLAGRGLVERLLRGVPRRAVLLPVPGAAHRRSSTSSCRTTSRSSSSPRSGRCCCPIGAYVFGRGIRAPRPAAPLFAVAATGFLFFKDGGDATMTFDFHIMGGTLASTLAGEYSFTIALALSLFFLGTLARALEPARSAVAAGGAPRAHVMSHLVVGDLRGVRGRRDLADHRGRCKNFDARRRHRRGRCAAHRVLARCRSRSTSATPPTCATSRSATTSTGCSCSENWFLLPARAGRRARRAGSGSAGGRRSIVAAITVATGLVFCELGGPARHLRQGAGVEPPAAAVLVSSCLPARGARRRRARAPARAWASRGSSAATARARRRACPAHRGRAGPRRTTPSTTRRDRRAAAAVASAATSPHASRATASASIAMAVLAAVVDDRLPRASCRTTRGFIPYWAKYNYTGYESGTRRRLHRQVVARVPRVHRHRELARARPHAVGGRRRDRRVRHAARADAAAVLDRTAASSRWKASTTRRRRRRRTTSWRWRRSRSTPSNPVRGLPYQYDRRLRPRRAVPPAAWACATTRRSATDGQGQRPTANPALAAGRDRARPRRQAAVGMDDLRGRTTRRRSQAARVRAGRRRRPARRSPRGSARASRSPPTPAAESRSSARGSAARCRGSTTRTRSTGRSPTTGPRRGSARRRPKAARRRRSRRCPTVDVSNIRTTESSVEFDVSRTGVPVMVKTSYFPNWKAEGADGPWRATPNFMVVVPTEQAREAHLRHATGRVGRAGVAHRGRLVGLGGLVWWGLAARDDAARSDRPRCTRSERRRRVRFPSRSPR